MQINFYQTDSVCKQHDLLERHHCLHVPSLKQNEKDPVQIIQYCLTECSVNWTIDQNYSNSSSFNFEQLAQQQVTSRQLYLWSAPIDLVEKYQEYLNQPFSSRSIQNINNVLFYNCTWPRFGSFCQYSFDHLSSTIEDGSFEQQKNVSHSSLTESIHDFYNYYESHDSNELTCYQHLKCHRGFGPMCLDWSEICDGRIDCLNGGQDEAHCWQLEVNQCEMDQYRCLNGQCISMIFYNDVAAFPECLDRSDEPKRFILNQDSYSFSEPSLSTEDDSCEMLHLSNRHTLTSSCSSDRDEILSQTQLLMQPRNLSEECWVAFLCMLNFYPLTSFNCYEYCQEQRCQKIIEENCSTSLIFLPDTPLVYGHMYFAYTKSYLLKFQKYPSPEFICMNKNFCTMLSMGDRSFQFNDTICYHSENIQMIYPDSPPFRYPSRYITPTLARFRSCASLPEDYFDFCSNHRYLYRCVNTSKCISKFRLLDRIKDCFYGDDEEIEFVSKFTPIEDNELFFRCVSSTDYISYRLVDDGLCDCSTGVDDLCDDERSERLYSQTHISFQTMCDGFTELKPMTIDGKQMTDETDCESWLCDNIYTRCDQIWNCLDGKDEIGCPKSLSMVCPSDHQHCVSLNSSQLICLPIDKVNDGHIDCLGATDERKICRVDNYGYRTDQFHCRNDTFYPCINFQVVCQDLQYCTNGDDQLFCGMNESSLIKDYFRQYAEDSEKSLIVYFSLVDRPTRKLQLNTEEALASNGTRTDFIGNTLQFYQNHCHRGLNLRIWNRFSSSNKNTNGTNIVCLCPPGFYGRRCQYQSQRVSLTLQFRALSDAWQTLFSIVILLIDQTYERSIHSWQKLTFLPFRDCQIKFSFNLLFSSQPRNDSLNHSIHIDIYEQDSHHYRGSYLVPIEFLFLPITRIALQIDIPRLTDLSESIQSCNDLKCGDHGRCVRYIRTFRLSSTSSSSMKSFCQCRPGWSGRYCNIQTICSCSSQALCLGILKNDHRSICLCPRNKFGPRCILSNDDICQGNHSFQPCLNGGRCISSDEYQQDKKHFTCLCPKGFTGDRCEQNQTRLIISFHPQIVSLLPQSMLVHFIRYHHNNHHENATTFKLIPFDYSSVSIHRSYPFHIAFIEFYDFKYYLAVVRPILNQSEEIIQKVLRSSDRCPSIGELLPSIRLHTHPLPRMKLYYLACQSSVFPTISCFFDDGQFCLCQSSSTGQRREPNCFEYDYRRKFDCLGRNACENGGKCFQDNPTCPRTSVCICKECSYGRQCQFKMDGFRLSLDAILGYHIRPNISILKQPMIIIFAFIFTIVITTIGILNGILTLLTFKSRKLREVGCGFYLLTSSVAILFIMILFIMKFFILLTSQSGLMTSRSILSIQCRIVDYSLRVCLNLDQWFSSCVSCERARLTVQGLNFNTSRSISTMHDPIYRRLIEENNEDEYRIWCIVSYSAGLQTLDTILNMVHFCFPFLINIVSASIIIRKSAQSRSKTSATATFRQILNAQIKQHKHTLIGPIVIVILSVPRLFLAIVSGCMKSSSQSWIYLISYFISLVPATLTFVIFVLPSNLYKKEFRRTMRQYRTKIIRLFPTRH